MNKKVLIVVGGSIGVWLGNCIFKKYIKPKFDEQIKEYEEQIEQATNEMIKEELRHENAMLEIQRSYDEWKKERDEKFAKDMAEIEAICTKYRENLRNPDKHIES